MCVICILDSTKRLRLTLYLLIVLENVAVYQHFRTSEIQCWYNCEQERRKKEGEKPKYIQKKYRDKFKDRYVCML
jgi:hypothetical protein